MAKATHRQIRAVQRALYKPQRLQRIKELAREISNGMNLNPNVTLQQHDIRNPAGSGPNWFIAATGAVDNNVIAAANQCDDLAKTILEMRADVDAVDFPADDKRHLKEALKQEAASWTVRGRAWRGAGSPNVDALVSDIAGHVNAAVTEAKHVGQYLNSKKEVGL